MELLSMVIWCGWAMVGSCLVTSEAEFVVRAWSIRLWTMVNLTVRWGLSPARWFHVQRGLCFHHLVEFVFDWHILHQCWRSGCRDQSLVAVPVLSQIGLLSFMCSANLVYLHYSRVILVMIVTHFDPKNKDGNSLIHYVFYNFSIYVETVSLNRLIRYTNCGSCANILFFLSSLLAFHIFFFF